MNITASDFSVASNGDLRSIAGSATYTALELHAWLQDLADNPAPTSDDQVSILGGNPSELAGKRNTLRPMAVTLLNGVNVDDVTSRRFNFGSIEQQGGQVLYTGLKTIGTVPGDASIYIVQNNAKINGGTKWWPAGPADHDQGKGRWLADCRQHRRGRDPGCRLCDRVLSSVRAHLHAL